MYKSKYDSRGAGREGEYAINLYDRLMKFLNEQIEKTTVREDCDGKDRRRRERYEDIKSRKGAGQHRVYFEECAANNAGLGTGWIHHDVDIVQLMIYQDEDNFITDIIFGRFDAKDAVKFLESLDLTIETNTHNELHKLYHRWSFDPIDRTTKHRGATVCVSYDDITSLPSFERIQVPRDWWPEIMKEYNDLAKVKAKGRNFEVPYNGIR